MAQVKATDARKRISLTASGETHRCAQDTQMGVFFGRLGRASGTSEDGHLQKYFCRRSLIEVGI
jgi:hypothetical protein